MKALQNQPTKKPTRKFNSGAIGGALATFMAGALTATGLPFFERLFSYPGLETALGSVITLVFIYLAKEYA